MERTGLDTWAVEKLDGYGLPKSVSEELEYIFKNIKSPGRVELLTSMREERIKFLETPPDEKPWEVRDHEEHVNKIVRETGLAYKGVNEYYLAIIEWLRNMMEETQKLMDQKAKET
jgi:hypothetical protein